MTTQASARAAGQAIDVRHGELAEAIVALQYERQPALWRPYGDAGRGKSVRDMVWHLSYLSQSLTASDPLLFENYCTWVKTLFAGLGFGDKAWMATLECTRDVIGQELGAEEAQVAVAYIEAGLARVREAPATPPTFIEGQAPLAGLARDYLDALLRGERHTASHLILEAVEGGTSVRDIYLNVFQRTQREIGRLWQINRVSVAQEHFCTAATQLIMSQLYPRIFATEKVGRRLVATCVGGELHEIGVRMVADFFEMAGWDTYYLGANTPAESVVQATAARQADVLGISATMTFHVQVVADMIDRVRAGEGGDRVQILVGGYPFNVAPDLWRKVGADGSAGDAQQAVTVANRLLTKGEAA